MTEDLIGRISLLEGRVRELENRLLAEKIVTEQLDKQALRLMARIVEYENAAK